MSVVDIEIDKETRPERGHRLVQGKVGQPWQGS